MEESYKKMKGGHGGSGSNPNDFTTFFFANIPNGYGEVDMFKIFRRWARVKEVFISRRLNKWGRRFGFVRFFEVRNVGRLGRDLDQIYIGNKKLHVNIPRYRRSEEEPKRVVTENRGKQMEKTSNPRWLQEKGRGHTNHKSKEVWQVKPGRKSYADVVKDDSQKKWNGPIINTEQQVAPWMEISMVGQFREELDFEQLSDEFVKGGMSMVRLRYMGDNLVLLTPRENINMEELFNLNREWFESVFLNLEPWTAEHVADCKVIWVRCYGLPLILWNRDCFSKLVGEVATLVAVHDSTTMWENLEYARLQVRLPKNRNANMAKSMKINDQVLSIYIEEEHPAELGGQCMCIRNLYDSSDSVSSSETYVEETALRRCSGEEVAMCGGEDRRVEEEMEEGDGSSANKTKYTPPKVSVLGSAYT